MRWIFSNIYHTIRYLNIVALGLHTSIGVSKIYSCRFGTVGHRFSSGVYIKDSVLCFHARHGAVRAMYSEALLMYRVICRLQVKYILYILIRYLT